jgi:two-component system, NarL family, sensor kinase
MSARVVSWLAWSICAVTLLVLALAMLLIVLGWSTPLPRGWTPWRDQTVSLLGIIGAPVLGGLIASRRPRNPYGWLWLGFGLGLACQWLGKPIALMRWWWIRGRW